MLFYNFVDANINRLGLRYSLLPPSLKKKSMSENN